MLNIKFIRNLSKGVDEVEVNGVKKVLKHCTYIDSNELSYAAHELICYNLLKLLKSKNLYINVPKVIPYIPNRVMHFENIKYTFPVVLIDHVGKHTRISTKEHLENVHVPDWIYWFDNWVGKIDSSANLLLLEDKKIVTPIDNEMVFFWCSGRPPYCHRVSKIDVKCHKIVEDAKSDRAKRKIKTLTDIEIWNAVTNVPKEMIPSPTLVAIWSGLCYRRDLL